MRAGVLKLAVCPLACYLSSNFAIDGVEIDLNQLSLIMVAAEMAWVFYTILYMFNCTVYGSDQRRGV